MTEGPISVMEALTGIPLRVRDGISVNAVVLTGTPAFSAGADLSGPAQTERARAPMLERCERLRVAPDLCAAWEALDGDPFFA